MFRNLHRMFPTFDIRGTEILAEFGLGFDEILPSVRVRLMRMGPARQTCGGRVVDRSWAAIVNVPQAPAATVGTGFAYVVRTPHGWQPWYLWLPNASAHGELLRTL